MAANILEEEYGISTETLITIGTPVREYQLESSVGQHINVYNNYDSVQVLGGPYKKIAGRYHTIVPAIRIFSNAENIKVILPEDKRNILKYGLENHSSMHNNIEVWKEYILPLIKK